MNPYLSFNGDCGPAFRFYEQCLGGKITFMMTYGESPMAADTPAELRGRIMHTSLEWRGHVLQGADAPHGYQKPQGIAVALPLKDVAEADRIFQGLAESGTIQFPIQETFWAKRFGMVTDRFGIPWMINCEK